MTEKQRKKKTHFPQRKYAVKVRLPRSDIVSGFLKVEDIHSRVPWRLKIFPDKSFMSKPPFYANLSIPQPRLSLKPEVSMIRRGGELTGVMDETKRALNFTLTKCQGRKRTENLLLLVGLDFIRS